MATILSLRADNFKRLRGVAIDFPASGVVEIIGANGSGKTSVIDSLWSALGGKAASPDEPIRKGQRAARSEIIIDGVPNYGKIRVVREWWLGGTKLTITDENENNIRSPQTLLDNLLSHIAFDPVEFLRLDPKQQFATFCGIVGVDFSDLDVKRKAAYEERTQVGKAVKTLEARVADMPERPPTDEVDVVSIAEKLRKAYQANAGFDTLKSQHTEQAKRAGEAIAAVGKAKQALVEATEKMTRAQFDLEAIQKKINEYDLVETDELQSQLDNATAINVQAKEYRERKAALEELQANRAHHEDLSIELDQIDKERRKRLAEAKMPVEGIDLTLDGDILLNDVPLSQASTAEAIRASVMIGAARRPELRLMNIEDGSLLDDNSFRLIAEWADQNGYQVIEERVGSGVDDIKGNHGVIIEEGEIVETKAGDLITVKNNKRAARKAKKTDDDLVV